jgi:hypothetical protein
MSRGKRDWLALSGERWPGIDSPATDANDVKMWVKKQE